MEEKESWTLSSFQQISNFCRFHEVLKEELLLCKRKLLEVLHQAMVQVQKNRQVTSLRVQGRYRKGQETTCVSLHGKHGKQQEGSEGRTASSSGGMKILLRTKASCWLMVWCVTHTTLGSARRSRAAPRLLCMLCTMVVFHNRDKSQKFTDGQSECKGSYWGAAEEESFICLIWSTWSIL